MTIRGRVYDAAYGRSAGIAGARVEFEFVGVEPGGVVFTDADGAFAASFEVADDDWLVIRVNAEGFYPTDSGLDYRGNDLRGVLTVNYGLEARDDVEIRGHVFDAAAGADGPVVGAQINFWQGDVHSTLTTDAAGAFTFTLALPERETLPVWVSAEGYFTSLQTYDVAALRRAGAIEVALQAAPARVSTLVTGLVYDASVGPQAPLAGAVVAYEYYGGGVYPNVSDAMLTGPDGRYRIELPLGPNDALSLRAQAEGYGAVRGYAPSHHSGGATTDFGLPALGGVALIEPGRVDLVCADSFTVTVTNVGPADEILTIVDFEFSFAYSQGVYGQGFSWDITNVQFPIFLAAGEHVEFPVWFDPDRFASRLAFSLVSGAHEPTGGAYFGGRTADCGCRGDCDGDGQVGIGDLVRGVSLALGGDAALCPILDLDDDREIAITEVLTAVGNALRGCAP